MGEEAVNLALHPRFMTLQVIPRNGPGESDLPWSVLSLPMVFPLLTMPFPFLLGDSNPVQSSGLLWDGIPSRQTALMPHAG